MDDPEFLSSSRGPVKTSKGRQTPRMNRPIQDYGDKGNLLRAVPSNQTRPKE